jgi:hypothetical protein
MAADFRLVANSAQRDTDELARHRTRDRLAERRLAHAGRADEAQDRPLHVALQLADGQILDDALLDLVEIVVVFVESFARLDGIDPVGSRHAPRHVQDPVDVRAEHLVLGRCGAHAAQSIELAHRHDVHRFGQLCVLDALAQLRQLVALALAELLLDRLELLPQVVLPLRVGHLLLRLRLDLALQLEQRDLARQRAGDRLQLLQQVLLFEERLLVGRLHVDQRCQHVREPQRVIDVHDDATQLLGKPCRQRQRLLDQLLDAAHVRVDLDRPLERLGQRRDLRAHRRTRAGNHLGPDPRDPLDDDVDPAADLGHLPDHTDRADAAQILGPGVVVVVLLQQQQDQSIAAQRAVHRFDGHGPVDGQRLEREGEGDGAPERQDGKLRRERGKRRFGQDSHSLSG